MPLDGTRPNSGDAKFGGVSLTKTRYMLFLFILHVFEYRFVFFNNFTKMINFISLDCNNFKKKH